MLLDEFSFFSCICLCCCRYTEPPPRIVLGSLVLRALYVGLDLDKKAVGLSNKLDAPYYEALFEEELSHTQATRLAAAAAAPVAEASSDGDVVEAPWLIGCAKAVGCAGWEQRSFSGSNTCDLPDCDAYFYHVFDEVSKRTKALRTFVLHSFLLLQV